MAFAGTFSKLPEEVVDVELSFASWCGSDLIDTFVVAVLDPSADPQEQDVTVDLLEASSLGVASASVVARLAGGVDDKVYSIKIAATTVSAQVFVGYLKMHVETTP